jgi:hypothetical protein
MLRGIAKVAVGATAATVAFFGGDDLSARVCALAGDGCDLGSLEVTLTENRVAPRALPRGKPAPVTFRGGGRIWTKDGHHPSALREVVLEIDRDVAFDADDLPACGYRRLTSRETDAARRVCRRAIVGWGTATFLLSYPENKPIFVKTDVTLFNGGSRGRAMRLFLHGFLPIRLPRAIVAPVSLEPAPGHTGGWRATVEIPQASEGYGSLIDFALTVGRKFRTEDGGKGSFASARCPDGKFELAMSKLLFKNENGTPGAPPQTLLKAAMLLPCTPVR